MIARVKDAQARGVFRRWARNAAVGSVPALGLLLVVLAGLGYGDYPPPQGSGSGGGGGADLSDVDEDILLRSDHGMQWTDSTGSGGTLDLELSRNAASELRVDDSYATPARAVAASWEASTGYSTRRARLGTLDLTLGSAGDVNWVSQTNWASGTTLLTPDTGLTRASAGILQVTDGSTGAGGLQIGTGFAPPVGGFSAGTASDYLYWTPATGRLQNVDGGSNRWILTPEDFWLRSTLKLEWNSTDGGAVGSSDTSLSRGGAGVILVEDALEVADTGLTLDAGDLAAGQSGSGYRLQWDASAGDLLVKNSSGSTTATIAGAGLVAGNVIETNSTAVGNVGTGEDDLMSYAVAADTLTSDGDAILFRGTFTAVGDAVNTRTLRFKVGSTELFSDGVGGTTTRAVIAEALVIRTGATTATIAYRLADGTTSATETTTASVTWSSSNTFKFTGQDSGGADDEVEQLHMSVALVQEGSAGGGGGGLTVSTVTASIDTAESVANNAAYEQLEWAEDSDADGWHDDGSNPARFTVPAEFDGAALTCIAQVMWASGGTVNTPRRVVVRRYNSSSSLQETWAVIGGYVVTGGGGDDVMIHQCQAMFASVSSGDYVTVEVNHENGTAVDVVAGADSRIMIRAVK